MAIPRTVIADDHPAIRTMLRQLIKSCALVVFEACNGAEALEAVENLQPDLLVLDVSMPQMGGFEVLRSLRARTHQLRIIMISEHNDPAYLGEAHRLGASDFLLKRTAARELPDCIERLFRSAT